MKRLTYGIILAFLGSVIAGCATFVTEKANLDKKPDGVRIYPPKVFLLVDTGEKKSTILYAPDYERAYDMKPITFLAKQDFTVNVEDGMLKSLTSNQDSTAILTFIKGAAEMGAKAAGLPVSSTVIDGTFGLDSGMYLLHHDGIFRKVKDLK